ncbi:LPXTG-site transpeptidase (sortase) family protein [Georgenia soli]|uniref:LPXTG-site transpeptidase (Sortase) family protein n=1 Tax=Georgenia soli TaxID=638953 RepID=A0A2A9ELL7_9MICO|nr:class F sortase [Georgenia soli]PFG39130.1 LPXTG-site transpeptidase (sortase) family protein [Georgenia soli]
MRTPTATVAALLLGPALLAGCSDDPGQPAPTTAVPVDTPSPAGTAPGTAASTVTEPAGAAPTDIPVRDAGEAARTTAPRPPVRLVYDALDIDMPVVPVGVADDGQMEVRPDALEAGWYRFGPTVGAEEGTAVVAAHAGSYVTPRGPFYDLKDARPGDRVRVTRADGQVLDYEVTSVEKVGKDVIDLEQYFRRDGAPRLVLFTCGGRWDEARQSYDDNVVVSARPVGG